MGNIFSSLELLGILLINTIKINSQVCMKPVEFFCCFPEFLCSFLFNQTLQCQVRYENLKGIKAAWVMLDTAFLAGSKLIKCLSLTHHSVLFFPLLYSIFSFISVSEVLDILKRCTFPVSGQHSFQFQTAVAMGSVVLLYRILIGWYHTSFE